MGARTNTRGGVIPLASTLIVAVVTTLFAPATAQAQSDLIFNEFAKLLASDGQALDNFGGSVAVSGDTACFLDG